MNKIQIALCTLAGKMKPGMVQNIMARLGSPSPVMFKKIQAICAKIIGVCAVWTGCDQSGLIPAFKGKDALSLCIGAIGTICIGIGGGAALLTTDPNLVSPEVKDAIKNELPQ